MAYLMRLNCKLIIKPIVAFADNISDNGTRNVVHDPSGKGPAIQHSIKTENKILIFWAIILYIVFGDILS